MSIDTNLEQGVPQNDDQDIIFEINEASVTFDMERGRSRVLDDATLNIRREEIIGIVGESGSGKSMFASALLNAVVDPGRLTGDVIYHPPEGDPIDLIGLDQGELKRVRWEEIAMVIQSAQTAFNPTMKIGEHFEETLRHHQANVEEGMNHAHQLLRDVYLEPERVMDSYPSELSGGMKQRALIALSLVLKPNVLVMDEPTAALDLLMQRSIISLLAELKQKYDLTLAFVTHDLPLVSDLADRLAVMYAFNFVEIGPTEEIVNRASHPYTRALINSVPNITSSIDDMEPIEGSSPDPVNVPDGCSYHPRCPLADEHCESEDPALLNVDKDHRAACFYTEDARTEIPLAVDDQQLFDPETDNTESFDGDGIERIPMSRRNEDSVIELQNIEVYFEQTALMGLGKSETVRAVDDVSLTIPENEVVALVGESGCGKTTLGKTAIGLQRPTDGEVHYRGQDFWATKDREDALLGWARRNSDPNSTSHQQMRRALQIVHQDPGSSLNANYTVLSLLSSPLKRWQPDLSEDDRRERIYGFLEFVGMRPAEDYAERYPHQLSGGEKQRVALIRALLMNPDLILADEAVSALDVSLRVEMMDLLLDLQNQFGTSYLFISHNLSNARYLTEKVAGRIGIMYLGELVEIGSAEQIIYNPKHPYTKVLLWATPDLFGERELDEPPVRSLDIPDSANPPSGCRFHTRCPEAREVCTRESPGLFDPDAGADHEAACFRVLDDHEYWNSDPIEDVEEEQTDIIT